MKPAQRPLVSLAISVAILLAAYWLRFYQLPDVPFGWHLDEAAHGLEARDLITGGPWPVFFSQFTGHEPLFIYLEAASFALFGQSMWAGRLVSASTGLLTVALTIPLCVELWPGRRGRRIGQWAAMLLAASLWHLIESRNGYRAILQPLVQLPALIFLLKAIHASGQPRARAWLWWGLAGFFTGLNLYTYLAARAFPLVIIVIGGAAIMLGPDRARRAKGLALAVFITVLLALPLAMHFYNRPIDFYGRATQISLWTAGGDPWGQLGRNLRDTLGMFLSRGDPSYKHNIANQPVFDQWTGWLFFMGLTYILILPLAYRTVGTNHPARRTALSQTARFVAVTLFSWLVIMLLPMILSTQDIPHYLRSIGILPVIMLFPAIVFDSLWSVAGQYIGARLKWPQAQTLFEWAMLLPCGWLAFTAYQTYFTQWHTAAANDQDRVVQMVYLAQDLKPAWQGEPLYISTSYPEQVTLAFLNPQMYAALHGFDGRQAVPLPPEGQSANYYILLEDSPNVALLQRAGLQAVRIVTGRFGQPVYQVYRWDGHWPKPTLTRPMSWSWEMQFAPGWQPALITAPVSFDNLLSLTGYDLTPSDTPAGQTVILTLYWQLSGPAPREYSMFAHVLDANSQVIAQSDANRYPATKWHAGELLLSEFPLAIPNGTPPGIYQLEIGVYHQPTGERLFILSNNEPVADRLLLQPIVVR